MGKIQDIIDPDFPKQTGVENRYKIIDQPFVNEVGLFKQAINIGEFGWYFIQFPEKTVFQKLIVQPGELDMDLYISRDNNCLLYSFYNSSTNKITITGKIVPDTRSIYSKIKDNIDDLELRQYYLNSSLAKTIEAEQMAESVPELMNMEEAARYLGIEEKTLYNWVSAEKIPVTKVGGRNKFRKEFLDNWLDQQTGVKGKKRLAKRRRRK